MWHIFSSHPFNHLSSSTAVHTSNVSEKIREPGDLWSLMEWSVNIWHYSHSWPCCRRTGQCTMRFLWRLFDPLLLHQPHSNSNHQQINWLFDMGQVMKVRLSCYLVCYQMIAKPGNKTAAPSWPNPYLVQAQSSISVDFPYRESLTWKALPCHAIIICNHLKWVAHIPIHPFIRYSHVMI